MSMTEWYVWQDYGGFIIYVGCVVQHGLLKYAVTMAPDFDPNDSNSEEYTEHEVKDTNQVIPPLFSIPGRMMPGLLKALNEKGFTQEEGKFTAGKLEATERHLKATEGFVEFLQGLAQPKVL